ncbi:hypothetical protein BDZ45DRAFT_694198 [Acephala macrosclerotiorum]|nr:hypothetical protein BDZ45DRAFT_694198 [Acephala macrosclerotiorum]
MPNSYIFSNLSISSILQNTLLTPPTADMHFRVPSLSTVSSVEDELRKQFKDRNASAEEQLREERLLLIRTCRQARERISYVDAFSPSMIMQTDPYKRPRFFATEATTATNLAINARSAGFLALPTGVSNAQYALWGVIEGASAQFALEIGEVILAPADQRGAALSSLSSKSALQQAPRASVFFRPRSWCHF